MALELQSFLVAIIVGAILFAEHAGGSEEVLRRIYQVTLAFALAFLAVSATTAFLPTDALDLNELETLGEFGTDDLTGSADRQREVAAILVGIAIALVVLSAAAFSRYSTIALGGVLGGLLLLLTSGGGGAAPADYFGYLSSLLGGSGDASQSRDIAYFVVLAIGSAVLLGYGYKRWDAPGETTTEAA